MASASPDAYQVFLSRLSTPARKAVTAPAQAPALSDDEKADYGAWRSGFGEQAKNWLDDHVDIVEEMAEPSEEDSRFGCVECESGEFPIVRLFKTADALARHIGKLEGRDVSVVPFYGSYLRISAGRQRYMQLPDGESLILVPRDGIGAATIVDADLVDFEWQEDGFIGPPELAASSKLEETFDKAASSYGKKDQADDDDHYDPDDDEEDESEED